MGEKLTILPVDRGLKTDVIPFNLDNDNFPQLINAFQWRGRAKRKRGTTTLTRFMFQLGETSDSGGGMFTISPVPITVGLVSFKIGSDIFVDPGGASPVTLLTNSSGTGVLDRSSGVLTITGSQITTVVIYYPTLPVMGLEDLSINNAQYPGNLGFDTHYSYNILNSFPSNSWNVTFYKNPSGTYSAKANQTPFYWNGQDYQQFWSTNYQNAFWVTNGLKTNPIDLSNIGMQYAGPTTTPTLTTVTRTSNTTVDFTIVGSPLVVGDYVFANEFTSVTVANASFLNFQTGYVSVVTGSVFTVTFPKATIPADTYTPGILQYLTNTAFPTKDVIRWYDGDPTVMGIPSASQFGWVNFMPPLFSSTTPQTTIGNLPAGQYYLVGAKMILPFKDRLLFFGAIVQQSTNTPIYLQDTIVYSQNGTPFYTASFTGDPTLSTTVYTPLLTPILINTSPGFIQPAAPNAYFCDILGFGGAVTAGVNQALTTAGVNQDGLITGFSNNINMKVIYTGDDILPFQFYIVNSDLGSSSTFSTIVMDEGVITRGNKGYIISDQSSTNRIDLDNLDLAFQIALTNNGAERFTAVRDFINEWIYFTYPSPSNTYVFPTQTFFYNYRNDTWSIFNESYTTYGLFRNTIGYTWLTIPWTWDTWNTPWTAGSTTAFNPIVIAGNQQGYIMIREDSSTQEDYSLSIQNVVGNTLTVPNHCLEMGDFIYVNNCLGTVSTIINGVIFQILSVIDINRFVVGIPSISGTYQGGGQIKKLYVPFIQTKQFPIAWASARKTRIGPQQYLLTKTPDPLIGSAITVDIYLSQNESISWNSGTIVPTSTPTPQNSGLIYSQIVFTCPEFYSQSVFNGALGTIGNGVQTSFPFNFPAIFNYENLGIVPGSISITVGNVATFTDDGSGGFTATGTGTSSGSSINYLQGTVIIAFTAAPTNQVTKTNFNYFTTNIQNPFAQKQDQIWHRMNTSMIGDTVQLAFTISPEQMIQYDINGDPLNAFAEVELHSFILDLQASQVLA